MKSQRKVEVVINGSSFVVELGSISGPHLIATVNGKEYEVKVVPAGGDLEQVGAVFQTAEEPLKGESDESPSVSDIGAITAPMPGNIDKVNVNEGDVIVKDQVLCTLEAMKMQNAIRSPRAGTIAAVWVTAGQAVSYGDTLFTFR